MEVAAKLLDVALSGLPRAVLALIPEHRQKPALERLQGHNPFKTRASMPI